MDPNSLAIPFAFILLAAVLCLLLIGSKWKWWQKLALILIVPAFGLIVWGAIESYKGWPSKADPPRRSLVHWVLIREADPAHGDPGAIYVWLSPLEEGRSGVHNPLEYDSPGGEPRAYKLPYTRSLHKGMQRAQRMLQEGRPVVLDLPPGGLKGGGNGQPGEGEPGEGEGDGDGEGANGDGGPNGHGGRQGYRYPDGRTDFKIYELPAPHPPQKYPGH